MIKVEEGTVSFGKLISKPTNVSFFTKGIYPTFSKRGGSNLIKSFVESVLTEEQIQSAREYASEQKDGKRYYKHFYKKCAEFLGCTPRIAIKLWNGAEYYTKIEPRKDLVDLLARGRLGRVNRGKFRVLVECEEKLREVQSDGLKNILPFVLYFKMLPHDLRKLYGKATWKKITANTFHRNNLIVKNMDSICSPFFTDQEKRNEQFVNITKLLLPVRSTLLANNDYMELFQRGISRHKTLKESFNFIYEKVITKIPMKGVDRDLIRKMQRKADHIEDTYTMAEQVGEKFNIWKHDIESFEAVHDRFQQTLNEIREKQLFSPDPLECLNDLSFKGLTLGEYSIELLETRLSIHQEGKAMGHCVGSYSNRVADGNYLVYSIKKNGERVSTLGLYKASRRDAEGTEWVFSQHYGRFNKQITDPVLGFLTDICLYRLNGRELVTDAELSQIAHAMRNEEEDQLEVDTLKFPVYNPASYKSIYDKNFK